MAPFCAEYPGLSGATRCMQWLGPARHVRTSPGTSAGACEVGQVSTAKSQCSLNVLKVPTIQGSVVLRLGFLHMWHTPSTASGKVRPRKEFWNAIYDFTGKAESANWQVRKPSARPPVCCPVGRFPPSMPARSSSCPSKARFTGPLLPKSQRSDRLL